MAASVAVPAARAGQARSTGPAAPPCTTSTTDPCSHYVYNAGQPGSREYWEFIPDSPLPKAGRPLLVFLHGCIQTAVDASVATNFNALAEEHNFVVVYPQQNVTSPETAPLADGNGVGCWNWFLPQDQSGDTGEPASIAGITDEVINRGGIDPDRVYVEGISAGADMAIILAATHPRLYAAVGAVAGCPYATCSDTTGRLGFQAMGTAARVVPAFIEQGTADTLNPYALGRSLVASWLNTDDLADDGQLNGSVPHTPSSVENFGFDQTPAPGSGNPCIQNDHWPCPGGVIGFQGTYPYTVERYGPARCPIVDFWTIHGMEHAYPNAPVDSPYTDPLGPDISGPAWTFLSHHSLAGC